MGCSKCGGKSAFYKSTRQKVCVKHTADSPNGYIKVIGPMTMTNYGWKHKSHQFCVYSEDVGSLLVRDSSCTKCTS